MTESETEKTRTEVVGVFDSAEPLQEAIDALLSSGFNRAEISLLAGERTVEEKLGHAYKRVEELEDDAEAPRAAYISTEARGDAEGGLWISCEPSGGECPRPDVRAMKAVRELIRIIHDQVQRAQPRPQGTQGR